MNLHTLSSVIEPLASINTKPIRCFFIIALGVMTLNSDPVSTALAQDSKPSKIYWSDGDSGRLDGMKFRLANIDAPETGSLKQRGGAKCEAEREIGFEAKEFIVEFTRGKQIKVTRDYGEDRYDRLVVDLSADGVDVAQAAVAAGHLRAWPHKKGRAQAPKPDWCAN